MRHIDEEAQLLLAQLLLLLASDEIVDQIEDCQQQQGIHQVGPPGQVPHRTHLQPERLHRRIGAVEAGSHLQLIGPGRQVHEGDAVLARQRTTPHGRPVGETVFIVDVPGIDEVHGGEDEGEDVVLVCQLDVLHVFDAPVHLVFPFGSRHLLVHRKVADEHVGQHHGMPVCLHRHADGLEAGHADALPEIDPVMHGVVTVEPAHVLGVAQFGGGEIVDDGRLAPLLAVNPADALERAAPDVARLVFRQSADHAAHQAFLCRMGSEGGVNRVIHPQPLVRPNPDVPLTVLQQRVADASAQDRITRQRHIAAAAHVIAVYALVMPYPQLVSPSAHHHVDPTVLQRGVDVRLLSVGRGQRTVADGKTVHAVAEVGYI